MGRPCETKHHMMYAQSRRGGCLSARNKYCLCLCNFWMNCKAKDYKCIIFSYNLQKDGKNT